VAKELHDSNRIRVVRHISTTEELQEYIKLWELLRHVHLNYLYKDSIVWKWMGDGSYSATSAYKMQFQGYYAPFQVGKLWKTKDEPKVKFFGWTTIHQKILTADNLAAGGMQHNNVCPLCHQAHKDTHHLLIKTTLSHEKSCASCGLGLQWKDGLTRTRPS
jgi:hypothetical protein